MSDLYPRLVNMARTETPNSEPHYGVKQVRGPFVVLPPNSIATEDDASLSKLCRSLRSRDTPLAADLFAGAGGISLGLERVGYKVVLGVDHYNFAVETHHHHFAGRSLEWDLADPDVIEDVAATIRKNKIELLAGGPPCQPFSKAGRSMIRHRVQSGVRDPHDERRDLWRSFLEVVQLSKPPAVIMENVPDMALDREMFIFRSIVEELEQEGYSVSAQVVETWRYGVPQMRQRLIIVALRGNKQFNWPSESPQRVTLWNAIGDLPPVEGGWRPPGGAAGWTEYNGPSTQYQSMMRCGVDAGDSGKVFDHITRPVREDDRAAFESMTHKTKYTDLAPEHQRYRRDIFDDKYKRLDENDLCRTITAHIAKDGYWYIHPRQPRTLTVREAARVQSFPDEFRFAGPPSAAFKQIGNAVPPIIGEVFGRAIRSALADGRKAKLSTRLTAASLAKWAGVPPTETLVPWIACGDRWKITVAELLLDRAPSTVIRSVWPVVEMQPTINRGGLPTDADTALLVDLMSGVGRTARTEILKNLIDQMKKHPEALWQPTIDRTVLPAVSIALADFLELAAPTAERDTKSEEPVLVTKGVLRVASRFQGNDVDKRNRQTDGRLAVARMIGLGPDSRIAHLKLVQLAADICTVETPSCSRCPLRARCAAAAS
ncbi:DNA (cytosine-5-)-methyltransferase [Williamsia serinedens]